MTFGIAAGRDYQRWLELGPGGVPHNVKGWLRVTYLRTKKREAVSPAVYGDRLGEPGDGCWLEDLPHREGPRPRVAPYPIPHRQADQPGDVVARARVRGSFDTRSTVDPGRVCYRQSFFEQRNQAITLTHIDEAHAAARAAHGEVAHIHPSDGSMHMIFSPTDARTVLTAGWGERHPLAGVAAGLPGTYLLIYSPRTTDEANVIGQLLEAAVGYMAQS